jgi:hypothetical protein
MSTTTVTGTDTPATNGASRPPAAPRASGSPGPLARLWPEPWASQVAIEAELVRTHLTIALAGGQSDPVRTAAALQVERLLAYVDDAIRVQAHGTRRLPSTDRWKGATVERAYGSLHGAYIALVDVLDEGDVRAWFPEAVSRVSQSLPAADPSRVHLQKQLTVDLGPAERRIELKQALRLGYEASDRRYAQVRSFRNLLWKLTVTVLLFALALAVVIALRPTIAPLCFHPAAAGGASAPAVCPTGTGAGRGPSSWDVVAVALMGLVGGALAATFAIRKLRGTDIPYDVPLALAVLKVPLSGLTAVVGILFMTGGFVPGLSDLDSQGQVLAYAVVFGYAQQLLTQVVDNRAQSVLNSVPSSEPAAAPSPT